MKSKRSKSDTLTQQQFNTEISHARTVLMDRWPFIGYLALNLRPNLSDRVPTAGITIDGTLYVNPTFWSELSPQEQIGLLAHEVLHPALACWARRGNRKDMVVTGDGQVISLWNLAHDLSFNTMIKEYGEKTKALRLPEGAVLDEKYNGMSAEEIYEQLLEEAKKRPPCAGSGGVGTLPNFGGGIGDDLLPDGSETADGAKAERGDKCARNKVETDWKVNVVAAAQLQEKAAQGSLPGWLQRIVNEITNPKLDWREELSRWVGENGPRNDYSFRRPSRRSWSVGAYLPSMAKFGIADDITVLLDTSGSISQQRLVECLSEIQGICEDLGVTIRVIVVDADIHEDLEITQALDVAPRLKGGGGSDFCPAFNRLVEENYDGCVVAFTDGMISVPAAQPPNLKGVLWVVGHQERSPTDTWGSLVRMPA